MWVCVCVYSNVIDYIKLYGDRSVSHGITMASANQTVRVSGCGQMWHHRNINNNNNQSVVSQKYRLSSRWISFFY